MIVENIRYQIPEEEARAFEDAYRSAGASLQASPHGERYEVARCGEGPAAYTAVSSSGWLLPPQTTMKGRSRRSAAATRTRSRRSSIGTAAR